MVTRIVLFAALAVAVVAPGSGAAAAAPETWFTNYDIYWDNAEFWFTSDVTDGTFECSLDYAAFSACTSPVKYTGLAVGEHHVEVRAVAADGTVDPWPANLTWTASTQPPPPPPAPANDGWHSPQAISGSNGSVEGTTVNATVQWDEPWTPNGSAHTVWYTWVAGRTADVTFTAPAGFTVSRFTGSSFSDGGNPLTFRTYQGVEYLLSVDGPEAPFTLSWAYAATGPANDYRADAQILDGLEGAVTGSTVGATTELNEPRHDGSAGENTGHSIWYRWTAPATGTAIFTTQGSSFDTLLRAYVEGYSTLVGVGWYLPDLNPWTTWSRVQLDVTAGGTYWLAVDGSNDASGDVQLSWRSTQAGSDSEQPTVQLWSPEPGSHVSGRPVTLRADASDNEAIDRVEFRIWPDESPLDTWFVGESTVAPYEVTFDTSSLEPGMYGLEARAFDAAGNQWSSSYTVIVGTIPPPTLNVPRSIVVEATRPDGALVKWSATARDAKGVTLAVACSPKSGSLFRLGTTNVTCMTADAYGNRVTKSFGVTVRDTRPPTLTVPEPIVVDAVAPEGAPVQFDATAVDRGVAIRPVCVPAAGGIFAIGDTTVTCTATDAVGNSTAASFAVHVKGASEQLADVRADLVAAAADKLVAQVDDVEKQLAVPRVQAACGGLAELADAAAHESGKRLTPEQAQAVVSDASRIRAVIGC